METLTEIIRMMDRLETVLPEWTRVMWTTPAARAKWDEIIHNIVGAWLRLERWTVVDGARDSCLTFCEPHNLPELARWATKHGVLVLPIAQVGVSDQYSAAPLPIAAGRPWQYRVIVCQPQHADAWLEAWSGGKANNEKIGELLGFPECCRRFFSRVWVDEKYLDTTWPMAVNGGYALGTDTEALFETVGLRRVKVGGFDACNILWRWMGVRAVAHLPCSFNCPETVKVAKMFRAVGDAREFGEWLDFTDEILSWPVEWSALHGIAEIKTPILKVSSRTDMTAEKYVVQREGSSYPLEGASGISFPYQNRQRVQVTKTPAFARAFTNDVDDEPTADLWTDNGFASFEAMNEAHTVLLEAAQLEQLEAGAQVLDLGCGNGRLLERVGELAPGLELYGIEADPDRCRRAGARLRRNGRTEHAGPAGRRLEIYQGSMFDPDMWSDLRPALVFFMPGRLMEVPGAPKADTLRGLLQLCNRAVFYAYGDWLEKGGILDLVSRAGLTGWEKVATIVHAPGLRRNTEAILANRC